MACEPVPRLRPHRCGHLLVFAPAATGRLGRGVSGPRASKVCRELNACPCEVLSDPRCPTLVYRIGVSIVPQPHTRIRCCDEIRVELLIGFAVQHIVVGSLVSGEVPARAHPTLAYCDAPTETNTSQQCRGKRKAKRLSTQVRCRSYHTTWWVPGLMRNRPSYLQIERPSIAGLLSGGGGVRARSNLQIFPRHGR